MGGCAELFGPTHEVEVAPTPPPHPVAAAPAPVAETDPKPKPKAVAKRPSAPTPADTQTAAAPAPADLAAPPAKLVGLTQAETVSLLGAPSAQWDRPPAKVWHYQGPDCTLDVFFYLDVSRNEFSALRFTAVGADATAATGQHCLNRIRDVAQHK